MLIASVYGICLVLLSFGCSPNNSATTASHDAANVDRVFRHVVSHGGENSEAEISNTHVSNLDCARPEKYRLEVVESQKPQNDAGRITPQKLNVVIGHEAVATIELPNAVAKNFSLSSAEKTKAGFELRVEWGGGLYHYEIQFNFICRNNNFYLDKVKNDNFSTSNPESRNLWDKKETKERQIEPPLSIEKFAMVDYLQ